MCKGLCGERMISCIKAWEPSPEISCVVTGNNDYRKRALICRKMIISIYPSTHYYNLWIPTKNGNITVYYGNINTGIHKMLLYLYSDDVLEKMIDAKSISKRPIVNSMGMHWTNWFTSTYDYPPVCGVKIALDSGSDEIVADQDWGKDIRLEKETYEKLLADVISEIENLKA